MKLRLCFLLALFLPELPLDPFMGDLPISWKHLLGTDVLGRDGLLRLLLSGARSFGFASAVTLFAMALAATLALSPPRLQGVRSAMRAVPPLLLLLPLAAAWGGLEWLGLALVLIVFFAIQLEAPLRIKLNPFRQGPAWAMNRVMGARFPHVLHTWFPWGLEQIAPLFPMVWLDVLWAEATLRLLGLGPGPQHDSLGLLLNEELPRLATDPTAMGVVAFCVLLLLAWSSASVLRKQRS